METNMVRKRIHVSSTTKSPTGKPPVCGSAARCAVTNAVYRALKIAIPGISTCWVGWDPASGAQIAQHRRFFNEGDVKEIPGLGVPLPNRMVNWILAFDRGQNPKRTSFTIKIPADTLALLQDPYNFVPHGNGKGISNPLTLQEQF